MPSETETCQATEFPEKQLQEGRRGWNDSQREIIILETTFRPMRKKQKTGEPEQKLPLMLTQVCVYHQVP